MGFLEREIFVKWVYQSEKQRHRLKDNRGKERNKKGVGGAARKKEKKENIALI